MKQVTKDDFWKHIHNIDSNIESTIEPTPWPYTCIFRDKRYYNQVYGKIVGIKDDKGREVEQYFIKGF